jgi:hypothetical protein
MTQNKIAPMTTMIRIPIINESTTISYHGGWDTQYRNPKLSMSANKRDLRP